MHLVFKFRPEVDTQATLKLKVESRDVAYQKITSRRLVLDTSVSLAPGGTVAGTVQAEGEVVADLL